jgi:hypothetical protein
MSGQKIEEVLEKTKKRLLEDLEETKKRLGEFKKRTATLAKKAGKEAEKVANISRLRLEMLPLLQEKDSTLKDLGTQTYRLVKSGKITLKKLKTLSTKISLLETKIREKEREIKKLKK